MARPIIIDTDPGQDDAVAILMALASPELDVIGITTVAGNVAQPLVTHNALRLVTLAGRPEVPVHRGSERPLVRPLYTAEYVHGPTGIDGADLPEPVTSEAPGHAVDFIVDRCRNADAPVTICALGPLTNLAAAIVADPSMLEGVAEIVLMGGAFSGGNTTPVAEFNIYVDPHAAQIVFEAGVPLTVMPLDVTHKALVVESHLDRLRAVGSTPCLATAGMLGYYSRFDMERYRIEGGPLHDPTVIAYLLRPDLFSGRRAAVAVETGSELTMGQTVADWWSMTDRPPNAMVMLDVDGEAFIDLVIERVALLR